VSTDRQFPPLRRDSDEHQGNQTGHRPGRGRQSVVKKMKRMWKVNSAPEKSAATGGRMGNRERRNRVKNPGGMGGTTGDKRWKTGLSTEDVFFSPSEKAGTASGDRHAGIRVEGGYNPYGTITERRPVTMPLQVPLRKGLLQYSCAKRHGGGSG